MAQDLDPKEVRLRGYDAVTNVPGQPQGNKGKHNINLYQYPSDLHKKDLLHYVEFAINVRGKSKYNSNRYQTAITPNSGASLTPEALSTAAIGGTAAAAGLAAGTLAGGLVSSYLGKVGKSGATPGNKKALGTKAAADKAIAGISAFGVGGAAAVATAGFISASDLLQADTSYRISDVINLHVEGPPTVRYSMNYANKDLGTLAGLIGTGFGEGTLQAGEAGAAALTAFAKLPGMFGVTDTQTLLSASAKVSLNPFKEVIFESVDFRSFALKYKFLPKSKQETESIRAIINLFKFHMHPEMSASKLFFIYPAEFQITYYFNNGTNDYVHKFTPCVLENMDVSYGGEQFSTFADGSPTEINMALTFRETEIITKEMLINSQGDL